MLNAQDERSSSASAEPAGWLAYENQLVGVLTVTFGVVMIDRLAVNFLAPFFSRELHLSNAQIGILASGLALTWAISGVVVGRFCDRLGHQRLVLCLAVVGFSLCSFLSGFAGSFGMLFVTRLLMGLSEGPVLPISHILLARESSPARRGLNMGVMQMLGSNVLGTFLAPLLLVLVADVWGWRKAFFVAGIPGLLCALLLWRVVRDPGPAVSVPQLKTPGLGPLLRSRNIVLCMIIAGLNVGWVLLCFVFLPLYFTQVGGFSPRTMSLLMSVLGVAAIVASLVVSGLSDRIGRKPVVILFASLGLLVPIGIALYGQSPVLLAGMLFVGFFAAGTSPLLMATIPAETAFGPHVATVVGLVIGAAEIISALVGPLLGGFVADAFGLAATLWLQVGLIVVVVILACFLRETYPNARPVATAVLPGAT